jgi:hypothetical protein
MRIENITEKPVNHLDDYTLDASYLKMAYGQPVGFPLLLDIRNPEGQLAFRLHLTPTDVAEIVAAVTPNATK